ncbi:uncharacterized protein LOC135389717 [Ornithodoros turicata]|uniref:uncharacterized protein LOC135389717 n=1 Tax=Ornithodoros turicata TaxID=34597 RepID=UPI00313A02D0
MRSKVTKTYGKLRRDGHQVSIQWISSHCKIPGNEKADEAEREAHYLTCRENIPLTKDDIKRAAKRTADVEMKKLLANLHWRHSRLVALDGPYNYTGCRYISRTNAALIHRLRLGTAFTRAYRYKLNMTDVPTCRQCHTSEDIHILLHCTKYEDERKILEKRLFTLDSRPLTIAKILGAWSIDDNCRKAAGYLLQFLKAASLRDL